MVAEGRKEDVDLAVKAAREAFDYGPWPRLSGEVHFLNILTMDLLTLIVSNLNFYQLDN